MRIAGGCAHADLRRQKFWTFVSEQACAETAEAHHYTMKTWVIYAIVSMLFAGVTSVIAKMGLAGISSEMGIAVRTVFVFIIVLIFAAVTVPAGEFGLLTRENIFWLGLSGVTTSFSWIFYYKAIKDGEVSTVALIDKGSIIVAVLLAVVVLKETLTPRTIVGAVVMLAGLTIIAKK